MVLAIVCSNKLLATQKVFFNTVSTIQNKDCPIIEIKNQKGIGSVTLTGLDKYLGKRCLLKMNLAGLEMFQLITDKFCIQLSVSSLNGKVRQTVSSSPSGLRIKISKESAFWLKVSKVKSENVIKIEIPSTITQYLSKNVLLKWIDFYR